MARPDKERKVRELAEELQRARAAVLTDYRGLTVQDASDLRGDLGEADTRFAIVKNRLTKLAMREAGLDDGLIELLEGPTAIAFVHGDPVAGVKRLVDAARRFPVLEVKGGYAEGRALSPQQVRSLAALESREVMLAKIAGLAKMEVGRMAWMLQALQSRFVSLMQALQEKLPGESPQPEAEETEPEAETPEASVPEPEPQAAEPEAEASEPAGQTTEQPTEEIAEAEDTTEQPSEEQAEGGT